VLFRSARIALVAFTAGIASQLGLSPLLVSMLTGCVIANLKGTDLRLFERFILQAEPIVGAVFGLLAGMLLNIHIGLAELGIAGGIVALRVIVKPILWTVFRDKNTSISKGWEGVAPVRQARIAIALGVSFYLVLPGEFAERLLTIVVLAGLMCDFVALGIVRFAGVKQSGLVQSADAGNNAPSPAQSAEGGAS